MSTATQEETKSGTLHFKISGEFITSRARTLVMEGEWEEAIRFLMISLHGFTYDYAVELLAGNIRLVGCSSSNEGVEIKKEVKSNTTKYFKQMDWLYGNYIREGRKYYRPYAYVTSFGLEDFVDIGSYDYPKAIPTKENNWHDNRVRFYANNRSNDVVQFLSVTGIEKASVLFEETSRPLYGSI